MDTRAPGCARVGNLVIDLHMHYRAGCQIRSDHGNRILRTDCDLTHPISGVKGLRSSGSDRTISGCAGCRKKNQSKKSVSAFHTASAQVPINDISSCHVLERRHTKLIRRLALLEDRCKLQFVILDCSRWTFVDFSGAEELDQLVKEFRQLDVSVLLVQIDENIAETLHRNGKLPVGVELFPTIHDAVVWASARLQTATDHLQNVHNLVNMRNQREENEVENLECTDDDIGEANEAGMPNELIIDFLSDSNELGAQISNLVAHNRTHPDAHEARSGDSYHKNV
ncbi:hypothetical protein FGIG_08356 [Fasciola gigantica]|uniref:STAS domain-containing protein n=1 Tax=Fasciola gigantica TaxID=46835 RepID=A0A504Z3G2_FASGI|nr:hypothetical protein FGIG_08356 [Fasciola gigantica]